MIINCSQRNLRQPLNVSLDKRLSPDFPRILFWSRKLAGIVNDSGFRPDMVVGIANKGLVPGKIISDFFNVPLKKLKISRMEQVRLTSREDVDRKYRRAPSLPQSLGFNVDPGMRLLIVDESVNTGGSVLGAAKLLKISGASDSLLRIAAIADIQAPKIADFWLMETDSKWYGGHFCKPQVDADYFTWMKDNLNINVGPKEKF